MLLHSYSKHVKEFLMLVAVVGLVAYILCQPDTVPQLEQSEKARSQEHASMRKSPPATSPSNVSATATPSEGSLAARWKP